MSYLDKLKQEAAAVKAREEAEQQKAEQYEEIFDKKVSPLLKKLHQYLQEMAAQLNTLKPDHKVSFRLEGVGHIRDLQQNEYLVSSYRQKEHHFFIRITSKSERKIRFEITNEAQVKQVHDYLWQHNIPFKWEQENNSRHQFVKAVFVLDGEIYSEFAFTGVPSKAWVELKVKNFPKLGKQDYILRADDLTPDFMDDLARYINHDLDDMDGFLKSHRASEIWNAKTTREKTSEQKMREQILAEMRAEKARKAKAQAEEGATPQKSPAASTAQKPPSPAKATAAPKKKGLFSSLFGKKS